VVLHVVLCFDMITSPLAQPRNLVLGHTVSAFSGVVIRYFGTHTGMNEYTMPALAVAVGIGMMRLFKCSHPPGGATALIGVIGGSAVADLGFAYILTSTGAALILLGVAVLLNNLVPNRKYPLYWN
jgi:CBS-domain-containing membrane protein